jgi:hypothetical protein
MTGCLWRIVIMILVISFMAAFVYGYVWLVLNGTGPFVDFLNTIPIIRRAGEHIFTAIGGVVFFVICILSGVGIIKTGSSSTR